MPTLFNNKPKLKIKSVCQEGGGELRYLEIMEILSKTVIIRNIKVKYVLVQI